MTLRILATIAILAGLAAAPDAKTFRWEPNQSRVDVGKRVDRALRRARERVDQDHQWSRLDRAWDRAIVRRVQRDVRNAERVTTRTRVRVNRTGAAGYVSGQTGTDADPCDSSRSWGNDDDEQHCEVRDQTLPAGPLDVNAGPNGGISVEAWDRNEIRVRAIVRANARTEDRAKALASDVQVQAGGGRVSATGPNTSRREWWSVSYRINVPSRNDLDLSTRNGGVTITGVSGNLRFDTTNGGVRLSDLAGRVNGRTTNGGVSLSVPDGYNAALEARTNNGRVRVDFPITVQGEILGRRGISTTLGSGGPPVRVRTSNGGVTIARR